jgi:hypothetical protein
MASSVARAWGSNQLSTRGTRRRSTVSLVFACAGWAACGGAPEKVVHPEPQPTTAPAPPSNIVEEPPAKTAVPAAPAPPAATTAPASPGPPNTYTPALSCDVRGTALMSKSASLWTDPQGSSAVAAFAGQPVSLIASGFPASASGGRIRVRTSGGVRVDGFLDATDLPLYTGSEVAVVQGHLWIAQGQRVAFAGASNGVTVEASVSGPVTQTFHITAPCTSLTLDKRSRVPWDVPGNGRGYLPQRGSLDLRDQPGGAVIQTLHTESGGAGPLLWSTENQGGYVHVLYHEDLVIDAWVASSDVVALKQGETMDRLAPPSQVTGSARLSLSGQPTLVRAQKDVPLRLRPEETARPIGAIETGGEVYLIQTVLGWTSVMPRALNVLPPGDRSFWVPSSEVGAAR